MSTVLILDEDKKSGLVLQSMVHELGYKNTRIVQNIRMADQVIGELGGQLTLILASEGAAGGADLPLARYIIKRRELDLVPLILTANQSQLRVIKEPKKHSRVDGYIEKPFGGRALSEAIAEGYAARARFRDTIVIFAQTAPREISEAVLSNESTHHWQGMVHCASLEDLKSCLTRLGMRAGGLLIDSTLMTPEVSKFLLQFKKTSLGARTSVGVYGRGFEDLEKCKNTGHIFFEIMPTGSWSVEILAQLSERLMHDWSVKQDITHGRESMAEGRMGEAKKLARAAAAKNAQRPEVLEFAGEVAFKTGKRKDAIRFFNSCLKLNPFSPLPYLRLKDLVAKDALAELCSRALMHCPAHPQVLAAFSAMTVKACQGSSDVSSDVSTPPVSMPLLQRLALSKYL